MRNKGLGIVKIVWILVLLLMVQFSNAQTLLLSDSLIYHNVYARYDVDLMPSSFFAQRRADLRLKMPENSVAILFSNPVSVRSGDVDFEYHQSPDFFYLTGCTESNAALIIYKSMRRSNVQIPDEIIFVQPKDPSEELWTGIRLGVNGANDVLGFYNAEVGSQFTDMDLHFDLFEHIYINKIPKNVVDDPFDKGDLYSLLQDLQHHLNELDSGVVDTYVLHNWLSELRQVKHSEEIALTRKAVDITCNAHHALMQALEVGMTEYQAEAIVEYEFKSGGAEYPAFPSILGGGENSCILHYESNRKPLAQNEMLVVDIGSEYHGYASDVTRTLPVNGVFSKEQKIIYDLVLKAQEAGIKACKPGNKFWDPGIAANEVIASGLVELGIIKSKSDVKKYFPHGTSHYVGLDVHDAGLYGPLAPGNIITVEPGIYIPVGSDCDLKWWNIGVRIEDDVLIVDDGYEVLSSCIPKTTIEIEQCMSEKSQFNILNKDK